MTIQSNLIILLLLLDSVLLSCVQSPSARDNVDCTYANSTRSSYADLCLSNEFYPLLPSKCHPSYGNLIYSEESYPDRTSSSIRVYGNGSFSVPEDLLAGLTGLKDYTIAVYFKEQVPNGTLFELNDYLAIRYTSERRLEYFLPQLTDKNTDNIAQYDVSLSGQWKSVFFTFQNSDGAFSILTNFGSETSTEPVTSFPTAEFATAITSITIGEGFNGFLQDIRVYVPRLQSLNSQVIIPTEASFLPQCLCQNGYSFTQSETLCTAMDESMITRYDTTASMAEFSTDTSTTTMWQSNNMDSPVSLVVGLSPSISLSKIFITFSSSLPAKITLQYYSVQASDWKDLQHFAENCVQSFEMGNDDQLKESFEVNCLQYTSNTTLMFLLAGTGSNARPLPSESETPFEVYYNASQVRLIMSGFMSSATNFAIRDIEICPNYCLDLERSCTTICLETAGMMTGDEGSGMSMSDILRPSSMVPTALVPSMSTTSSMENNQGNSNMFVSIAMSASSKMTEVNTVVPFTTTSMMLLQSTTMSFNILTTMTLISSSTMPIVGVTSSLQPVTQPESTSTRDQSATSSLAADMFGSPIPTNLMTSAVFNPPLTSTAIPQAPSTTPEAFTSENEGGILISISVPLTPTPSSTMFISSSTQVQASSSSIPNLRVTTSSSMQDVVQTSSSIIVQESSLMSTSQAVPQTSIQATALPASTTQDTGVSVSVTSPTEEPITSSFMVPISTIFQAPTTQLVQGVFTTVQPSAVLATSPTEEPITSSFIVPTSTIFQASTTQLVQGVFTTVQPSAVLATSPTEEPITSSFMVPTSTIFQAPTTQLVQGVLTTVQPSAATSMATSVQPESTTPTRFSTRAVILHSLVSFVVLQESPSSPGPVSTPISIAVEPSETSIVATPSQSTIASLSSGVASSSLSRTPELTIQSSLATATVLTPTPQPTISAVTTAAEMPFVSESSLRIVATLPIPSITESESLLLLTFTETIPSGVPTSIQTMIAPTPTPTPTIAIPLSTSVATMIISAGEATSVSFILEQTISLPSIEIQSTPLVFTTSGLLTNPVEITQTPATSMATSVQPESPTPTRFSIRAVLLTSLVSSTVLQESSSSSPGPVSIPISKAIEPSETSIVATMTMIFKSLSTKAIEKSAGDTFSLQSITKPGIMRTRSSAMEKSSSVLAGDMLTFEFVDPTSTNVMTTMMLNTRRTKFVSPSTYNFIQNSPPPTNPPTSTNSTESSTTTDPQTKSTADNTASIALGGIATLFATITVIFILVYIVKKCRKRRFHDEEGIVLKIFHEYDYLVATDGPPLPPRRPLSKSFTESSTQFAQHGESAENANIIQQDEQPNTERRHPIIANLPLTDLNRMHSEANLSTCSSSGYSLVDDAAGISMHKNLAYTSTGLVLANTHVQESSTPTCTELTSEQVVSSSEDDHEFFEPVRQQSQHCDSVGLPLRTDALSHSAALTSAIYSGTTLWDTPSSGQQAEDQSCAIEVQHCDCDEDQSLLSHPSTYKGEPEYLSLQGESSSHTNNDNQGLALYERICGYERIHHIDIPLESLLQKGGTKLENS